MLPSLTSSTSIANLGGHRVQIVLGLLVHRKTFDSPQNPSKSLYSSLLLMFR